MDLPMFLLHGNLYHAQQVKMFSQGLIKIKPVWKNSLYNYALRILATRSMHEPVAKLVDIMIKGKDKIYPGTNYSVTEQTFDCWWDVIYGADLRIHWQSQPNAEVAQALQAFKKTPQYLLSPQ